jgi:hypothetical protein
MILAFLFLLIILLPNTEYIHFGCRNFPANGRANADVLKVLIGQIAQSAARESKFGYWAWDDAALAEWKIPE